MKLKQFLIENKLSAAEFGRQIGVLSRMTICRYISGERVPDRNTMPKIVGATRGAVTPNDFHDIGDDSSADEAAA